MTKPQSQTMTGQMQQSPLFILSLHSWSLVQIQCGAFWMHCATHEILDLARICVVYTESEAGVHHGRARCWSPIARTQWCFALHARNGHPGPAAACTPPACVKSPRTHPPPIPRIGMAPSGKAGIWGAPAPAEPAAGNGRPVATKRHARIMRRAGHCAGMGPSADSKRGPSSNWRVHWPRRRLTGHGHGASPQARGIQARMLVGELPCACTAQFTASRRPKFGWNIGRAGRW